MGINKRGVLGVICSFVSLVTLAVSLGIDIWFQTETTSRGLYTLCVNEECQKPVSNFTSIRTTIGSFYLTAFAVAFKFFEVVSESFLCVTSSAVVPAGLCSFISGLLSGLAILVVFVPYIDGTLTGLWPSSIGISIYMQSVVSILCILSGALLMYGQKSKQ